MSKEELLERLLEGFYLDSVTGGVHWRYREEASLSDIFGSEFETAIYKEMLSSGAEPWPVEKEESDEPHSAA